MSERDEFEAWAGRNFLDVTRNRGMVIDYVKPDTQLAWLAWQAARAPQAVPALTEPIYQWRGNSIDNWTDCAKETYDNIGLTLERYPADQPTPTWERRIVYAAPQPSPEPEKAEELLKACRRAVMALAHASERMPQYNADYQAVSDAIAAYVDGAAYPKYQD